MNAAALLLPGAAGRPALPARLWQDLLGLLLTLAALLAAALLALPRPQPAVTELPPASCDLQQESCRLALPDLGEIEVHLRGGPIAANREFAIAGRSVGGARPLSLIVRGIDLAMDGAPASIAADADGNFSATSRLPLCTTGSMRWQLRILLGAAGRYYEWPLIFRT